MSRRFARRAGVALLCLTFLFPMAVMFSGALQPPGRPPPDGFDLIPDVAHWENFNTITTLLDLWGQMRNSVLVVVVAVPLTVLIASWAGFTIVTGSPRARRGLIAASVVAMMIPTTALWVPRFVLF